MLKFIISLVPLMISAQTGPVLTLTGPSTVKPGTPVIFNVNLSGTAGTNLSALDFTFPFPNSALSFSIGPAGTSANKQLFCSATSSICVIAGMNQTPLTDGIVGTITWTPNQVGAFQYNLSKLDGASDTAKAIDITTTAGPILNISVTSPCDINADGKIDISDIQAFINTFVFTMPSATQVNPIASGSLIVDIQRIATAGSPGGMCIVGP